MKATIFQIMLLLFEQENEVCEDFLFRESLPLHTTAEALFDVVNDFITANKLQWGKCVGITTVGAQAMSGMHKGLVACIQKVAPHVKWTHCCIHREVLAACRMPSKMKTVLGEAVEIVNFIEAHMSYFGLHSGLSPSVFPTNDLYAFLFNPFVLHATSILS
jgi:hypothetical protein